MFYFKICVAAAGFFLAAANPTLSNCLLDTRSSPLQPIVCKVTTPFVYVNWTVNDQVIATCNASHACQIRAPSDFTAQSFVGSRGELRINQDADVGLQINKVLGCVDNSGVGDQCSLRIVTEPCDSDGEEVPVVGVVVGCAAALLGVTLVGVTCKVLGDKYVIVVVRKGAEKTLAVKREGSAPPDYATAQWNKAEEAGYTSLDPETTKL